MKIEVGLFENSKSDISGWKILCEQEKIPHRVTDKPDCPIILCVRETPSWFLEFIEDGGIGIVTGCEQDSLPFKTEIISRASLEYVDFSELGSSVTKIQCLANIFDGEGLGKIHIHENRVTKKGIIQDQFPVFIFKEYGKGGCWFTGLPLTDLLTSTGDTLRSLPELGGFSERIVSVDKHNISKALRKIIIDSFHRLDIPYIHLWYYPQNFQSAFTFRIDVDGIFGHNLKKVSEAAIKNKLLLTFFINKSLCENDSRLLFDIDSKHEIGNHADVHNLYSDYESNYKNIKQCSDWLDEIGIKQGKWFAAPRGMWNYSLQKALEDLGYKFSSDFGYAIAGYPFYPYLFEHRSKTLQIPVNPFSAERASIWHIEKFQEPSSTQFVAKTFTEIIDQNYYNKYPIMLYSHPEVFGEMAEIVFEAINENLSKKNIWKTTLSEFADWWMIRDTSDYEINYDQITKEVSIIGNLNEQIKINEEV